MTHYQEINEKKGYFLNDQSFWKSKKPRELKHDHIWGTETCRSHGCLSCCACVKHIFMCQECFALGTRGKEGKQLYEYFSLSRDADVGPSLRGKELREKEGEKDWLEVSEKEKVMEWQEVDKE